MQENVVSAPTSCPCLQGIRVPRSSLQVRTEIYYRSVINIRRPLTFKFMVPCLGEDVFMVNIEFYTTGA